MASMHLQPTGHSGTASKVAVSSKRINIRMVQNALLVWLDSNIDDNDADCRNTLTQLRSVVNTINTYTDAEQCLQFLQTIEDEKACMIISGSLGQYIMPRIHDMIQVDSIFIFCGNKKRHEQWPKEWPKIKDVFTEITPICEALKKAAQQCEQDATPISFMATSGDMSKKNLEQLEPSFMYTQILKEILLTITFEQQHFKGFIQSCREALVDNDKQLKILKQLEQQYHDKTPIWWYTCDCFLYTMLNRALRVMDGDMIIQMGFFLGDVHRHISQLHQEQFGDDRSNEIFTVYRGQALSTESFKQMSNIKGGLMSFNNFLSTSKKRKVALEFIPDAMAKPEMVRILFVMKIDPAKSTTPFASINGVSFFDDGEDEVLFAMHTVFRIGDITLMDGNIFQVALTLTSDDDEDLRILTDRIREETDPALTGWYRVGSVLLKMGQSAKAQEVYEILLEQTTDEGEKGRIYQGLGQAHYDRGCYQAAMIFHEKSLKIRKRMLPPNHPDLAASFYNIGNVYYSMGDYPKALLYYEKALAIEQQSLPPNHPALASSFNNIGNVYYSMGDYPKALSSHEKALAIKQQSLPPNHPGLAASFNNIGLVYNSMGDYPKALSSHEKALAIKQQSLPPNHPGLAASFNNIGLVYNSMGDYPKALSSHEKALAIRQQSLPPNHPDLASSFNNIGLVYDSMGDYPKALSSYEKALAIKQQSLPPNHPDLASSYGNIGNVYSKMGDYPKARSFYERAMNIGQQSLPPNHPSLKMYRNNLEIIKNRNKCLIS